MDLRDLLATRPEDLAAKQEEELRKYAAEKLRKIAKWIMEGNYTAVSNELEGSPAGDDHGCDNTYISFAELSLHVDRHGCNMTDIGDVISKLEELQRMQKAKVKK